MTRLAKGALFLGVVLLVIGVIFGLRPVTDSTTWSFEFDCGSAWFTNDDPTLTLHHDYPYREVEYIPSGSCAEAGIDSNRTLSMFFGSLGLTAAIGAPAYSAVVRRRPQRSD